MAHSHNTRLRRIAAHYAKLLSVRVTASTVARDIEENAYFPSLLSLSDTFDKYNVPNYAFRAEEGDLDQIPPPFIAYSLVPEVGKDFVIVTAVNPSTVSFIYRQNRPQVVDRDLFMTDFQEIVWTAQPGERSGEKDYSFRRRQEMLAWLRKAGLFVASLFVLSTVLYVSAPVTALGSFLTVTGSKLLGLVATVCLLVLEMDKDNVFVKNLCGAGRHTNCGAVLTSKAARIAGFSWAEIGFFYFGAGFTWLFLPGMEFSAKAPWLANANVLAAPYIIYSIYYQWRVIRQWCLLCVTVQIILGAELFWSVAQYRMHPDIPVLSLSSLFLMTTAALVPLILWFALKPVFRSAMEHRLYQSAYKRLQYNPDIFFTLLRQQERSPDGWDQLGIRLGAAQPSHVIVKVCNPYCGPCSKAHPQLEALLKKNQDVQVRILFSTGYRPGSKASETALHLLAIASEEREERTMQALDEWYLEKEKDHNRFASRYPVAEDQLRCRAGELEEMNKWCKKGGVTHTPTLFLDGYRLPENYGIEELGVILSNPVQEDA